MAQSKIIENLKRKNSACFSYARLKSDQLTEKNGLVMLVSLTSYIRELLEIVSRNIEKEKEAKNTRIKSTRTNMNTHSISTRM
jgi:hypothetical protein